MAAKVKIVLNRAGVRKAALTSQEVRDMIGQYGEQVAERARQNGGHDVEVYHGGKGRARTYVWLLDHDSAVKEAKDRILGRALGSLE